MSKLSIRDLELNNKYLFVRVDFNVPLSDSGLQILDDTRIKETLPTLEYALRHHAKVIVASHLGRPKGKPNPKYSLRPVVDRLRTLLDHHIGESVNVAFSPDCVGDVATELARQLESRQVLLLENLRFHPEEEANDPAFSKKLASLAEIYVNDAFGSAHRAHASVEGLGHRLPSYAGSTMQAELEALTKVLETPSRPLAAIVGGAAFFLWRSRNQTSIYNVDADTIQTALGRVFERLGLAPARSGDMFYFAATHPQRGGRSLNSHETQGIQTRPAEYSTPVQVQTLPTPVLSLHDVMLEVDVFRLMSHAMLRWEPVRTGLRQEIERELERELEQMRQEGEAEEMAASE